MRTIRTVTLLMSCSGMLACSPKPGPQPLSDCKTVSINGNDTTWLGSKNDTLWSTTYSDTVHKPKPDLATLCAMASDTVHKP